MKHAMIPDTQIYPGSDVTHIAAAAKYLRKHKPDKIIIIGDWWDMPSVSSYDRPGDKGWEDKCVKADLDAGWAAMRTFLRGLRTPKYDPEIHYLVGNHEERIVRASNSAHMRMLGSILNLEKVILTPLNALGVITHPFLTILELDGICYSHYFVNPTSLFSNAIGGTIESKLKNLGHSFTMGHQQKKQTGEIYTCTGKRRRGLVCGRFYPDYHDYLGPQKNSQSWSGILLKHEVSGGDYDLMEVSMDYLLKGYAT
jgi:hypothetical protein